MDFNSRVKAFKNSNPKLKQLTLRISEDHAKKLSKIAKNGKIKEGLCLRLLAEFAIDSIATAESNEAPPVDENTPYISHSDFKNLEKRVESMNKQIERLSATLKEDANQTSLRSKKDAKKDAKKDDNSGKRDGVNLNLNREFELN